MMEQDPDTDDKENRVLPENTIPKDNKKDKAFGKISRWTIIILVVLLNFFGFFKVLPSEIDFIEKIVSWTLLGILLYNVRLSEIFFGERHKTMDLFLILSYFGLIAKGLVQFSLSSLDEHPGSGFSGAYMFIIDNAEIFTKISFIAAVISIIFIALYVAKRVNFNVPSMMHIIHEEGPPSSSLRRTAERFILTNLVFFGFFVIVFNLIAEWLAIAVDDPLLLLLIIAYIFAGKHLTLGTKLEKLGKAGEDFYREFISMFQSEKKIWFALSGILVLHILTDVANFMIPYLFGLSSTLYIRLGENHQTIPTLLSEGLSAYPELHEKILLVSGYGMNVIGIILLMIGPAFIWYKIYKEEEIKIHPGMIFLFFSTLAYFILDPVFTVGHLEISQIVGADIMSQQISPEPGILAASLSVGVVSSLLSMKEKIKKAFVILGVLGIEVFFFRYIYHYFISVSEYYIDTISGFFAQGDWFFTGALGLFFVITVFFYLMSSVIFLRETWS